MKKSILFILVAVLAVSLIFVGCTKDLPQEKANNDQKEAVESSQSEQSKAPVENDYKMAYITMAADNPYFVSVINGMKDKANELGIEFSVNDPQMDPAKQVSAVENYIESGMDALIISPIDGPALEAVVKRAQEKGIKIISQAQIIENADVKVTLDEYQYGYEGGKLAGRWITEKLNGEAEVALLVASDLKALVDRKQGLRDGILEVAPNAQIVSEQPGNSLELGLKAAENILQANPNVKVIASVNDAGALGAMEGVKSMGKDTEDFYLGGLDAAEEALTKIKENTIYRGTVDLAPFDAGAMCIEIALKQLNGEPVEETIFMDMTPIYSEDM